MTLRPVPGHPIFPRPLRWVARLLAGLVALAIAGAVVAVAVLPRLTGGQAMTVLSGSMTPTIPVGSLVLVRPIDPGALQVGDVATYQVEPGRPVYVTHRVVAVGHTDGHRTFTFKGDANKAADTTPIVPGQVRGKVWFHVPHLGRIRDELSSGEGRTLLVGVLLAGYAATQLTLGVRERRKEDRRART